LVAGGSWSRYNEGVVVHVAAAAFCLSRRCVLILVTNDKNDDREQIMQTMIVLAMHGAPPKDFPQQEMAELFGLHTRLAHVDPAQQAALKQRHDALEAKMRAWPRTAANDPFYAASQELAAQLRSAAGCDVVLGFNEFCAPTLDEALDQAVEQGAERVVITTPMMTQGGEHATLDIPRAIQAAQERHPNISFVYAWPFAVSDVAGFLAKQVQRFA
jgi:sirohydrochlorin cobaltochelatase